MIPRASRITGLLCALAIALPAAGCGPDFPEAIFVRQFGPDSPYSDYVAGHLGVPRTTFRVRHLAVAYDVLNGRTLSAAEQRAAEAANNALLQRDMISPDQDKPAPGYNAWVQARNAFNATVPGDSQNTASQPVNERSVPGASYDTFTNCLDNAYATAARTLTDRAAARGAHSPEVREWIHGQDQVFANCDDLPASYAPNNYRPQQPPPVSIPLPVKNGPLWLQQDRAYQIAAAHFYALQFDDASAGFRAIAADHASPWSPIAEYVTARTMIREATLGKAQVTDGGASEASRSAAAAKEIAGLRQARAALTAMRAEPRMAPLRHGIDGLLGYLDARIDPQAQRLVLAARLTAPTDPEFGQDLIDLTYVTANPSSGLALAVVPSSEMGTLPPNSPLRLQAGARTEIGLTAWLDTLSTGNETAALANWRSLHTNTWLLAALMIAKPGDVATAELLHAAEAVPRDDPAWTGVTFYRLRLMPRDAANRTALVAAIPGLEKAEGPSTLNLFASLDGATAPNLEAWLRTAGRVPSAEDIDGDEEELSSGHVADAEATTPQPKAADQPCGPALFEDQLPLFTPIAAEALNTRMPIALLATAAESHTLAPNLRFAVAQAAWARAVLLDQPAVARRMTPILVGCRAAWKPVLAAYDDAAGADARHVAGLLALMRFASIEPNVRSGEPREQGFATYSELRDNWWDKTVMPALDLSAHNFGAEYDNKLGQAQAPTPAENANSLLVPSPLSFLSAAEKSEAASQLAKLKAIPPASDYFAGAALAWYHAHPNDPADPDLLGEAMRVARNAPRTDNTPANEHALFDALHTAFPNSPWAKRYTTWE